MKRFRFVLVIAILLLCMMGGLAQNDTTSPTGKSDEVFHKDIELSGGSSKSIDISLKSLLADRPELSVHKNTIVVQIQNEVITRGDTPVSHLIDVSTKLVSKDYESETVDLKDIVVEKDNSTMILHYAVYDMCNIDDSSYITVKVEAKDGTFRGFVSMIVVDLEAFSIKCIEKNHPNSNNQSKYLSFLLKLSFLI